MGHSWPALATHSAQLRDALRARTPGTHSRRILGACPRGATGAPQHRTLTFGRCPEPADSCPALALFPEDVYIAPSIPALEAAHPDVGMSVGSLSGFWPPAFVASGRLWRSRARSHPSPHRKPRLPPCLSSGRPSATSRKATLTTTRVSPNPLGTGERVERERASARQFVHKQDSQRSATQRLSTQPSTSSQSTVDRRLLPRPVHHSCEMFVKTSDEMQLMIHNDAHPWVSTQAFACNNHLRRNGSSPCQCVTGRRRSRLRWIIL